MKNPCHRFITSFSLNNFIQTIIFYNKFIKILYSNIKVMEKNLIKQINYYKNEK